MSLIPPSVHDYDVMIIMGRYKVKNVSYDGNGSMNIGRLNGNQATTFGNGFAQKNVENEAECSKDSYNHFTSGKTMCSATTAWKKTTIARDLIMMAHIQPTDNKSNAEPTYDAEVINELNASQIDLINGLLSKGDHE
ncbi:hypothetical protein Tco_0753185 [Tanacetum coccineum]